MRLVMVKAVEHTAFMFSVNWIHLYQRIRFYEHVICKLLK